jgi:Protein of unknown function (DUF3106)
MSRALVLLLAVLLSAPGTFAQRRPGARATRDPQVRMLDRLNRMSPEQRERFLRDLPPERRNRIERQLERYSELSPEDRQRLRDRYQRFRQLPPDKQAEVRRLFRRFSGLPPARRPEIRREFIRLRSMSDSARRSRLESEEFRQIYSREERRLLEDLAASAVPQQ